MMKAAVFENGNENIKIKLLNIPNIKNDEILVKVLACGVCSGDELAKVNGFNITKYPIICGHEVVGIVDKLGSDLINNISNLKINDMVGVAWFGGYNCNKCYDCLNGYSNLCLYGKKITGMEIDGGFAEYMVANESSVVKIPNNMNMEPVKIAPLLCAGLTMYNSIKSLNLEKGSLVGILGIGGLGHLGILYCKAMGLTVIAISRNQDKKETSLKLGADHFIELKGDYVNEIRNIGRVQSIIVTSPSSELIEPMLESLCNNGKLLLLSILDKGIISNAATLVNGNKSIIGWSTGDTRSLYESLEFAKDSNIQPIVNIFTLDNAQMAFETINKAKFRNVIKIN